jgi:hypothetical protein
MTILLTDPALTPAGTLYPFDRRLKGDEMTAQGGVNYFTTADSLFPVR